MAGLAHMSMEKREFRIGYNLLWRLTFFLFAICMLLASILLLVQSLLGTSEGLLVPSSMLVAAILMSFYLIPFISTRQQMLVVTTGGLQLVGDHSRIVLPWESVAGVRFKRVMLVMPYLIIALSSKEQFAQFIDENPRSFLSKWTAHVGVLRWYPWLLRWLFSVPKKMTTVAKLEWLERRYGGAIVIDVAAVNGRGPELERAIKTNLKKVAQFTELARLRSRQNP
jgi:hypothetical protein